MPTPRLYNDVSSFTTATAKVQQAQDKADCEAGILLPPPHFLWKSLPRPARPPGSLQDGAAPRAPRGRAAHGSHAAGQLLLAKAWLQVRTAPPQRSSAWLLLQMCRHCLPALPPNYTPHLPVELAWLGNTNWNWKMCLN